MKTGSSRLIAGFGLLLIAISGHAAPILYQVQSVATSDLGTLGGPDAQAADVNNSGDIVGRTRTASMQRRGFIWRNGVMSALPMPENAIDLVPIGINDYAEVVGEYGDGYHENDVPFYWSEATGIVAMSHSIHPGESYDEHYVASGIAINNSGFIAGKVRPAFLYNNFPDLPCYRNVAVTWQNPYVPPQILECPILLDGNVGVSELNSSGWIVGYTGGSAVVWKGGVKSFVPKPFGASSVGVYAINDSGVVVGSASIAGRRASLVTHSTAAMNR